MKAISVIWFYIALNIAAIILSEAVLVPAAGYTFSESVSSIQATFNWTGFSAVSGLIGAGVVGLIGLFTKQYVYASGAIILWVIGIFLTPVGWLINGVPNMLRIILPAELSYLVDIFQTIMFVIGFMFLAEIATSRQLT